MGDDVNDACWVVGFHGMTVIEGKGVGRQERHKEPYRGMAEAIECVLNVPGDVAVSINKP